MPRKPTTEEYIAKAKLVHGDKYLYSKTNYIVAGAPVTITCRKHGDFQQHPSNHLAGNTCPACSNELCSRRNRSTNDIFITKAVAKHGSKYDYSKVNYVGSTTAVQIVCPVHGVFEQTPSTHLRGCDCPKCSTQGRKARPKKTTKQFITEAIAKHGTKYTYGNTAYTGARDYLTVTCPKHGDFKLAAGSHTSGTGCAKCGFEYTNSLKKGTSLTFETKAKVKHDNKYDYRKVIYVNSKTLVTIICPEHGEFQQRPDNHLFGLGCGKCGITKCSQNRLGTTGDYIKQIRRVHGDKYSYCNLVYTGIYGMVTVTCSKHGDFKISANAHRNGNGCPSCGQLSKADALRSNVVEYIRSLPRYLRNNTNFSKLTYTTANSKGIFICKKCFWEWCQSLSAFRKSPGCAMCSKQTGQCEKDMRKHLLDNGSNDKLIHDKQLLETPGPAMYRYDFRFTDRKILIELDDAEHYRPTKTDCTEYDIWLDKKTKDVAKNKLAVLYGYVLLRIPYTEFNNIATLAKYIMQIKKPSSKIGSVQTLSLNQDNSLNIYFVKTDEQH